MRNVIKPLLYNITTIILFSNLALFADGFLSEPNKLTSLPGNEINPFWINDSTLCFQYNYLDENSLYIYNLNNDSLSILFQGNFKNPVIHPDKEHIVFDTRIDSTDFLYKINIHSGDVSPLFSRKIKCRNAAFSKSNRQVYFTGYDEKTASWEIYSYDFVYDNINKLTNHSLGNDNASVSNDGKNILYCKSDPFTGKQYLNIINWYGERKDNFDKIEAYTPTWDNTGLKIFYVAADSCLYSLWKNGTHLEKLTEKTAVLYPAVSPDNTKIALSVKNVDEFDIYVFELW